MMARPCETMPKHNQFLLSALDRFGLFWSTYVRLITGPCIRELASNLVNLVLWEGRAATSCMVLPDQLSHKALNS